METIPNLVGLPEQRPATDFELLYRKDVLGLRDGQTEDHIDERLMTRAKELGVDLGVSPRLKPLSTRTDSSDPRRRSTSTYSTASRSTQLTSVYSEASREQSAAHDSKRTSRASLSLRDYDIFLARGTTNEKRTSLNFSPPSTRSSSSFSLSLHSPETSPKRRRIARGLSLLRLYRSDTTGYLAGGCPHCPKDPISQWRAVHRVPCGHRLCTQALRNTVQAALLDTVGAVPSCCGLPVPGSVVESVMTLEEQRTLLNRLDRWDEAILIATIDQEPGNLILKDERAVFNKRKPSIESKVDSVVPRVSLEPKQPPLETDSTPLSKEQSKLQQTFTTWTETQRTVLQTTHQRLQSELQLDLQAAEESLFETQASLILEAEDRQVKVEADLREAHAQESRDQATALRHMEAYCAGTYSTGEAHHRLVTKADIQELEKARRVRDGLWMKHQSAINILRGEQGRRMGFRVQRQEREVLELKRGHRKRELEFERGGAEELRRFEDFVAEKTRKLKVRTELQNAISAREPKVEVKVEIDGTGTVPGLEWFRYEPDVGAASAVVGGADESHDLHVSTMHAVMSENNVGITNYADYIATRMAL